jgi:dTDP-3-amino-3,4,6-trideoxy-alpha-D-glucose transaminase
LTGATEATEVLDVPFSDVAAGNAEIRAELDAALARTVDSGRFLLGPELEAFQRAFAEYCGTRHCVGVASGLSALELALRGLGIGPGDEVIVPAYTWVATWLAVTATGAVPVAVDAEESSWNIDPARIEAAVGERTKAIVPVHLRGEPADMDAVLAVAGRHDLAVVEDAAQAHGARCRGRRVGGLGDAAAFSFYPSKNLGALGDGGAVTTDDDELADRLRLLRNYGTRNRYEIEATGVNSRLAEIQAAALGAKLPHLDRWNATRAELAGVYTEALAGLAGVTLPRSPTWAEPVWHHYVVALADRDRCAEQLRQRGIETLVHYPVLPHLASPYRHLGLTRGSFPVAERLAGSVLSLPLYPQLASATCARVAAAVAEIAGERAAAAASLNAS